MAFTEYGRQSVAYLLGSSLPSLHIQYVGIGTGSATSAVTDIALTNEVLREGITGSPNFSENYKSKFQGDYSSTQLSGLSITEFGLFDTGSVTGYTGSTWQREVFSEIEFDGSNELQILSSIEVVESGT